MKFISHSPKETQAWGTALAKKLKAPCVISLEGELGAGKTCLVKGIAQWFGAKDEVRSPSFTLINEYKGTVPLYHIDLYRLHSIEEFCDLGYEEYFYGNGITLVEWGEKVASLFPKGSMKIRLSIKGPEEREIECLS